MENNEILSFNNSVSARIWREHGRETNTNKTFSGKKTLENFSKSLNKIFYLFKMSIEEQEQRLRQIQRQYVGFFDDGEAEGKYQRVVGDLIKDKKNRLLVNINDLRRALPDRTKNLIEDAFDEVLAMQRALKEYVGSIDPSYAKETTDFFVGFEGAFGSRHVTARTLTSRHINNLVCVEGMYTLFIIFEELL